MKAEGADGMARMPVSEVLLAELAGLRWPLQGWPLVQRSSHPRSRTPKVTHSQGRHHALTEGCARGKAWSSQPQVKPTPTGHSSPRAPQGAAKVAAGLAPLPPSHPSKG